MKTICSELNNEFFITANQLRSILEIAPSGEIALLVKDSKNNLYNVVNIEKKFDTFFRKELILHINK